MGKPPEPISWEQTERELVKCEWCDFYCDKADAEEMQKHEIAHFMGPEEENS